MSNQREILQVHIGQCGAQVGSACWELFCLEHGVQSDGTMYKPVLVTTSSPCSPCNAFLHMSLMGKVTARAVMVDLEPTVIGKLLRHLVTALKTKLFPKLDEIRTGSYRNLFRPDCLITGKEDAACCFARGMYTVGREMLELTLDRIRKTAEDCDHLQGLMYYRSYGGGTGSGFTSLLSEHINHDYQKITTTDFGVYPSPRISPIIVEPYNTVFSAHNALEYENLSFIMDNEATYDILANCLNTRSPTYTNINRLLAQVVSALTTSLRYDGGVNVTLAELETNLVPYPRIHFPLITFAPLIPQTQMFYERATTAQMTNTCFEPGHQMIKCDPRKGKFISCCLLYRGQVNPIDVNAAINYIKTKRGNLFVDWSPTGFKVSINYTPPACVPGGDLANVDASVVMLSNTTAIRGTWEMVAQKFNSLFKKRAFIHHYVGEGMEESEFLDALEDIRALIIDYKEIES